MKHIKKTSLLSKKTEFTDVIFDYPIFESNIDLSDRAVSFQNCTFSKEALFKELQLAWVSFVDCKFFNDLKIESCQFERLTLGDCRLEGDLNLQNNKITERLNIEECKTPKDIIISGDYKNLLIWSLEARSLEIIDVNTETNFLDSSIEFLGNCSINRVSLESYTTESNIFFKQEGVFDTIILEGLFLGQILFSGRIKCKYLIFESSSFENRIEISEGKFESVFFYRSDFKGIVWLNGYSAMDQTFNDILIDSLTFHSNTFERNITIDSPRLKFLDISNNNFKKVFQSSFQVPSSHTESDIHITINGTNQGNILLQEMQTNLSLSGINLGNINCRDVLFSDLHIGDFQNLGNVSFFNIVEGNLFTIENSSVGRMEFLNTDINVFKEIVIADSNVENTTFSSYPKKIRSFSSNPKVGYGIRIKDRNSENLGHVYNQLKQVARKKGDIDTANKYQSLEYKQLMANKKLGFDKILLFLNWISNRHGSSWIRGVVFTLSVSILLFSIYLSIFKTDFLSFGNFGDYILFLTSFPKMYLEKYVESNDLWYVSLVIWTSRVFVSYGIYQTVAAFRKYGKN